MNTATKISLLENCHEVGNGLSMAWNLANVRDDAKRAELQAPIIAAQAANVAIIDFIEEMAMTDGDDRAVSRAVYAKDGFIASCSPERSARRVA